MERRNTLQCKLIYDTVVKLGSHVSADEVYKDIKKENEKIGRATVYRNLNKLCDEKKLVKVVIPGCAEKYDVLSKKHYHAECIRCGKIFDICIDNIPDFKKYVKSDEFQITEENIFFKGYCKNCK